MYMKYQNIVLSFVVLLAMIMNFIVANVIGMLIPIILKKLKFDPVVGSSILLTAVTDSFGFFILLSLAKVAMNIMN